MKLEARLFRLSLPSPLRGRCAKSCTMLKNAPGVFFETGSQQSHPNHNTNKKGPPEKQEDGLRAKFKWDWCRIIRAIPALTSLRPWRKSIAMLKNAPGVFFETGSHQSHPNHNTNKKGPPEKQGGLFYLYGGPDGIWTRDLRRDRPAF